MITSDTHATAITAIVDNGRYRRREPAVALESLLMLQITKIIGHAESMYGGAGGVVVAVISARRKERSYAREMRSAIR